MSLSKRPSGRWQAQYRDPTTGRRVSKSFRTKGEAQAWERDALHAIDAGEYVAPTTTTVAAVCEDWLAEAEALGRLRHSTLAAYRSDVNRHIIPRLGRLVIADLSPGLIESRLIVPLVREGLANTTIRGVTIPLGKALDRAVRHRLLRINPARGIAWREVLPEPAPKAPQVTFTTAELSRLIDAAPTDEARTFLGLMAGTGLRIGEALALRRRDLGATTVAVAQTVSRGRIGPPKTAASEAVVPVLPERREHLDAARLLAAGKGEDALVFSGTRGGPLPPTTATRRWLTPALAAVGLPRTGWHVFRRSYSLILADRRVSVLDTRDLMRHANADLTVNTYQRDDGEARANGSGGRWAIASSRVTKNDREDVVGPPRDAPLGGASGDPRRRDGLALAAAIRWS